MVYWHKKIWTQLRRGIANKGRRKSQPVGGRRMLIDAKSVASRAMFESCARRKNGDWTLSLWMKPCVWGWLWMWGGKNRPSRRCSCLRNRKKNMQNAVEESERAIKLFAQYQLKYFLFNLISAKTNPVLLRINKAETAYIRTLLVVVVCMACIM